MVLYNSALVSWSLFYLGQSFDYPLPWQHCPLVENLSVAGKERDRGMQKLGETLCEMACKCLDLSTTTPPQAATAFGQNPTSISGITLSFEPPIK